MSLIYYFLGTGIYVSSSAGTGIGSSSGTQPNNSYAVVYSNRYHSSTRIGLYCCSSSIYNTGGITFPNSRYYTSSYSSIRISQYSSTDSYAGCIYMSATYNYRYSFRLPYSGTHTCSFGNNQVSSIALYNQGTSRCNFLLILCIIVFVIFLQYLNRI